MAWRGLVAHGWKPSATDGSVTTFVRGASTAQPPFREPRRTEALFCQGWFPPDAAGRQASSSHAALWAHGPGFARFFVIAPEPLPVTVSLDGRPHTKLVVRKLTEVRVGLSSAPLVPGRARLAAPPDRPRQASRRADRRLLAAVTKRRPPADTLDSRLCWR